MLTMFSSLAAALLLACPLPAAAQLIAYPGCSASWTWSFNSYGQNPCAVAAYLQGECDNGDFSIPPLVPGDSYTGPTGPNDESDLCKCNTVVYSLMSACDACQFDEAIWFPWKTWSVNCTAVDPPSTFSNTIPNATRVPAWAFLDVTKKGTWDPVLSYQVGDSPEVAAGQSGTLSPIPTPTTTQTSVPGLSDAQVQFMSKGNGHHSSNAAAIAGGVLGGIVFIVSMVGLMLWRQRFKRRKATRAAAAVILGNRAVPLQEKKNREDSQPGVFSTAI